MTVFIVAVFIAACIVLYQLSEPIAPKEMLVSIIPAWLQGLGTVGAAYFAWKAFTTWREQDAGRRRASAAEELLKAVHRAADAVSAARSVNGDFPTELHVMLAVAPGRMRRVEVMERFLGDLDDHLVMVKQYEYGKEVENALLDIISAGGKVRRAYRMIESIHSGADDLDEDEKEQQLSRYLRVVIEHYGREGPWNALADRGDDLEQGLRSSVERIEKAMGPVIRGT